MIQHNDSDIADFWLWFQSVQNNFGANFENSSLISELDERISRLGRLSWEIGPSSDDGLQNILVFSPSGDKDLLKQTKHIVSMAPRCNHWEFFAAKPPKHWNRSFRMIVNNVNHEIDASGWRYLLYRFDDGTVDIVICAPQLSKLPKKSQNTAAEIVLDAEIGEEKRIEIVHGMEIVDRLPSELRDSSSSIAVLASHLNRLV